MCANNIRLRLTRLSHCSSQVAQNKSLFWFITALVVSSWNKVFAVFASSVHKLFLGLWLITYCARSFAVIRLIAVSSFTKINDDYFKLNQFDQIHPTLYFDQGA